VIATYWGLRRVENGKGGESFLPRGTRRVAKILVKRSGNGGFRGLKKRAAAVSKSRVGNGRPKKFKRGGLIAVEEGPLRKKEGGQAWFRLGRIKGKERGEFSPISMGITIRDPATTVAGYGY